MAAMKDLSIAARRLRNSHLSQPTFEAPDEVVRWHGAVQAQDYGPAKWSIGQRAAGVADEDLDKALADGSIIRTHALRPTWHFIAGSDLRWVLALTGPRVQQSNRSRYRELGLDERTLARCERAISAALDGGRLTRNEIGDVLDDTGIDRSGQRLPYILMHCELEAIICSGGLTGKQHTYALVDDRIPTDGGFDRDRALGELTRRYLTSHGPATIKDLRWWSGLTVSDIKQGLNALGSEVRSEEIDGLTLWSMASEPSDPDPERDAHLLQTYDELIVGYTESRFMGDPRAETARAAWGDRTLPTGVVILKGSIGGRWRRTLASKDSVTIVIVVYERPKPRDVAALEDAADALGRFLGRAPTLEIEQV
jgi:hypothetical protein